MIKIAFPIKDNKLSSHFERCTDFQIYSINNNRVVKEDIIAAPLEESDSIPGWLSERDVSDVIAADIGLNAIKILTRHKINVFAGVKEKETQSLVQDYLDGVL